MSKNIYTKNIPERVVSFFNTVKNNDFLKGCLKGRNARFEDFPILDKVALRNIISSNFDLKKETKGVFFNRTGGTLGDTLFVPIDAMENRRQRKILAKYLVEDGLLKTNTIALNLFVYKNMYRPAAIFDDVLDFAGATSLGVGDAITNDFALKFVERFSVNMLIGTPSRLFELASFVIENNIDVKIPDILFSGELLNKSYQTVIEKAFKVENIFALFGATEVGIWGYTNYNKTSLYKIIPEIAYVEIENPDEEGFGHVVVTNINKTRFPILRYKNHDIGRLVMEDNNNHPMFELKGRGDFVFRIGGSFIYEDDFKPLVNDIEQYQVQLSYTEQKQTLIKVCLVREEIDETDDFIILKTKILDNILKQVDLLFEREIQLIQSSDLIKNIVTGKTPALVDMRH